MPQETCILTTKDFTILEVMRDRCQSAADPLATLLDRKLRTAVVVFREDIPANVATLRSRVTFRVDGGEPMMRVLSHDKMAAPLGMFIPITAPRGLALLGLAQGQRFVIGNDRDGVSETIELDTVHYQPEAARLAEHAPGSSAEVARRRAMLRVVTGHLPAGQHVASVPDDGHDDPGPSAA